MAKIITFQDIRIKEFSISKNEGKWTISLVYSLLDADEKEWDTKRIQLEDVDFTATQKQKIQQILTFLITKIKTKEEI